LAVNKRKAKDEDEETEPNWFNIVAWGKTAVLMDKLLEKGNRVMVSGTLVSKTYQTSTNETRYSTEIVVQEFMKL